VKTGAGRLSPRSGARYIHSKPIAARLGGAHRRSMHMAAIIALGLAFGIFALLNLIDYKRLD
jgi:hypothetical protein